MRRRLPKPHTATTSSASVPPSTLAFREHDHRRPLYNKLVGALVIDEAWSAYQQLLNDHPTHARQAIPQKYLHGFAASLVSRAKWMPAQKTRTQTTFLRLLSVLNTIYYTGGQVRLWEWNALMECAGRGWRRTRMDDFNASMGIFQDMLANRAPGSSLSDDGSQLLHDASKVASQPVSPDVVTYTTLLAIAGRTLNQQILQEAETLLVSSGLAPSHITHLAYIRYHARKGKLAGVRSTLAVMKANGIALGMEGINACVWAYGRNGRLDISALIYRILRHRVPQAHEAEEEEEDVTPEEAALELEKLEGIVIPPGLKPDAITYYTLVQAYAYRGHFHPCLAVFTDMIASPHILTGSLADVDAPTDGPTIPDPVLPVYRALFLGFARHAMSPRHAHLANVVVVSRGADRPPAAWTLAQLAELFATFVGLPGGARPNARTVYWLLVAFAVTSGYDRAVLRDVWARLAARYGEHWDGRVRAFRDKVFADEFDAAFFEDVRTSRDRRWDS